VSKKSTAQSLTIPPPVGGWNTRDPISAMGAEYAVEMDNYFPNQSSVDLVNGYRYHSKDVGDAAVNLLVEFYTGSTRKLVAAGKDGEVYDATTPNVSATSLGGGASGHPFVYACQFKSRLFLSQGATSQDLYYWDGSSGTLTNAGFGMPAIATKAMCVYRSRLYGTVGDASIWYTAVDSYAAPLAGFTDFLSVLKRGGNIIFLGSVTRAKDFSEDELFCIISDQGEVLVYQGDSPESTSWGLIGSYSIPRPLGIKAFFYIGANLCILTSQGMIPMSEIMGGTSSGKYLGLSDSIASAFSSAATTTLLNDNGWCGVNYPRGNFAVCNIPVTAETVSYQYYMNTLSQAWCRRTNQNAFCWAVFNDELYFGGLSGRVFKADYGDFDEDPANEGDPLSRPCKLRPAYNYLGDRVGNKHFVAVRPLMKESEGLSITVNADVDFNDTPGTDAVTDTADTSYKRYRPDVDCNTIGKCVSVRFDDTVTTKRRSIEAIDIFWREGDII